MRAWDAIGQLLAEGRSWSGRERNCCFLNTRDGRFANVAAITGLDVPQDSRGVAITDWDGDGDLDLWTTNRTRPRIQFWRNDASHSAHWLSIQLTGTRCNRDAIGTQVTLRLRTDGAQLPPITRFISAGDGHLSQSSKTLHFGLGDHVSQVDCEIRWPDGSIERIADINCDQTIAITQGQPLAITQPRRKVSTNTDQVDLNTSKLVHAGAGSANDNLVRIVTHARLPLPVIQWITASGVEQNHAALTGRPVLLVLWASWCQPCVAELDHLAASASDWQAANLQVQALNVEELDLPIQDRTERVAAWDRRDTSPIEFGVATSLTAARLDLVQRTIVGAQEALPIPSAFLLDERGRLLSIYKGGLTTAQVIADLKSLSESPNQDETAARNRRVPFEGRWFLNPVPADLLAIPQKLRDIGQPEAADAYVRTYIGTPKHPGTAADERWFELFESGLATAYFDIGMDLAKQRHFEQAEAAWKAALQVHENDRQTLGALASLYGQEKRYADTLAVFQHMLRLNPQDPFVANNVAWLLATAPQRELRDPAVAVEMAQAICEQTQQRVFSPLDTLAAAYAASGRFDEAIQTAETALRLAKSQANERTQAAIRDRLEGYRNRTAYLEPAGPQ